MRNTVHQCDCTHRAHAILSAQIQSTCGTGRENCGWALYFPPTSSLCIPGVVVQVVESIGDECCIRVPQRISDDQITYGRKRVPFSHLVPIRRKTVCGAELALVRAMAELITACDCSPFAPWRGLQEFFQDIEMHVADYQGEAWRKINVGCDRLDAGFEANIVQPFTSNQAITARRCCPLEAIVSLTEQIKRQSTDDCNDTNE